MPDILIERIKKLQKTERKQIALGSLWLYSITLIAFGLFGPPDYKLLAGLNALGFVGFVISLRAKGE